jgi:hypothetical protein
MPTCHMYLLCITSPYTQCSKYFSGRKRQGRDILYFVTK